MQFDTTSFWIAVGSIATVVSVIGVIVIYVIRGEVRSESSAVKTEVKEIRIEFGELKRRVDKMEIIMEKLADQKAELAVLQDRQLASGKRQDEADARTNELAKTLFQFMKDKLTTQGQA